MCFDCLYFRKLEMIELWISRTKLGFGDVEVVADIRAMKAIMFFGLRAAVPNDIRENKLREPYIDRQI
jgi:hypothetical protein